MSTVSLTMARRTIICLRQRGGRWAYRHPCAVCGARVTQVWLCDGATGLPDVTCDLVLCAGCRVRPAPEEDRDYCPMHVPRAEGTIRAR